MVGAHEASEEGVPWALHPGPPFPQGRAELSLCVYLLLLELAVFWSKAKYP